ncbi:hypothetical protein V6N12_003731 [Hibiscus sabdariffa]|uniref:RNase H type-1 domain-containing protein n=1 Tax=Hibiscus sabdariffa TaxID=183260 RepID=A0ABR2CK43_9ROSI
MDNSRAAFGPFSGTAPAAVSTTTGDQAPTPTFLARAAARSAPLTPVLFILKIMLIRFKVMFECGNELVIGWMLRPQNTPANLKDIIDSCLSNNSNKLNYCFKFVPKEYNTVTDGLAKKRIHHDTALSFFEQFVLVK